jgi:hypothetical protein
MRRNSEKVLAYSSPVHVCAVVSVELICISGEDEGADRVCLEPHRAGRGCAGISHESAIRRRSEGSASSTFLQLFPAYAVPNDFVGQKKVETTHDKAKVSL